MPPKSSFFNYVPGSSLIHRLDPRTKYHFTVILIELLVLYDNPIYMGCAFLITVILWAISGLSIKDYISIIKILLLSIVYMLIFNGFFIPGEIIIFQTYLHFIGRVTYTLRGLLLSISLGFRFLTLFLMVPIVISTTKPLDLIASMRYLKIPYKLSFIVSIAISFFPTLQRTLIEVQEAQRSRGLETEKGNFIEKLRKSFPIVFPMVSKCLFMVDPLSWTIESRGFGLTKNPTIIRQLKFTKNDYIIIGICWMMIILIPLTRFFLSDLLNFPSYLQPVLPLNINIG